MARLRPKRRVGANQEPKRAKTQRLANAREPHSADVRQWARPGKKRNCAGPQAAGFESNVRTGTGPRPSGAGQSAAAALGPRTLGHAAPPCAVVSTDSAPPRLVPLAYLLPGGLTAQPGGLRVTSGCS